jgi:hypothetical protein
MSNRDHATNDVQLVFIQAQPPREVFTGMACGHVDNASALTICPQVQQQQEKAFINSSIKATIGSVVLGRAWDHATGGILS